MSPVLHFDIMAVIIDIVAENQDTNLLKELALVSHSFHQICSKHLFATIELHDAVPNRYAASSKKGFVKLLEKRPDIVKYIRKLTYIESSTYPRHVEDYRLLSESPILPKLLRTISGLNCLTLASNFWSDWNELDSSLTSAFLHLMHLPTINHIDLSFISNFPLSSLIPAVNLLRLDILCMDCDHTGSPEFVVQSEMPNIREFHTKYSPWMTTELLLAKRQDGRPAFNFTNLRRLSIFCDGSEDVQFRNLLLNAKLLEKLHLSFGTSGLVAGFHHNLFPIARTLKVLDLRLYLKDGPFNQLCEELEAIARRNWLESLSLELDVVNIEQEEIIGSALQKVEEILVKPGWSALRRVSLQVSVDQSDSEMLAQSLNSLPDKYLSHLPKLEGEVSVNPNLKIEAERGIVCCTNHLLSQRKKIRKKKTTPNDGSSTLSKFHSRTQRLCSRGCKGPMNI